MKHAMAIIAPVLAFALFLLTGCAKNKLQRAIDELNAKCPQRVSTFARIMESSYDGEKVTATYPADKDGLKITEAGTYTVSFRPKADGDDKWYEKVLKAEKEQDASSTTIPSTTKSSTSSTTTTSTTSKAAVQTGDVSMALIILLVLLSATAGIYFARKKMN